MAHDYGHDRDRNRDGDHTAMTITDMGHRRLRVVGFQCVFYVLCSRVGGSRVRQVKAKARLLTWHAWLTRAC